MTSLSRQLRQISERAPQTKVKPSLVLSSSQANDADRMSIYAIGQNGLQELTLLDPIFQSFEQNLFSEVMVEGDVALMVFIELFTLIFKSQDEKKVLDSTIKQFLQFLSPYFLHNASFKALEWLIRRYRVHEYNVDDLVKCALPFHETMQFVHLVRTLIFTEQTKYRFVEACKKSKIPLERQTLVERCRTDLSALKLICDMFQETIKLKIYNKYICSLFLCTLTQLLMEKKKPGQEYILVMFSCLLRTSHKDLPVDFTACLIILFPQLTHWIVMNDKIFAEIQQALIRLTSNGSVHLVMLSVLQIFQAHPALELIDCKLVSLWLESKEFHLKFQSLTQKYACKAFVRAFSLCLARNSGEKNEFCDFLSQIIVKGTIQDHQHIAQVTRVLFEAQAHTLNQRQIIKTLVSCYASVVNELIQEYMNKPEAFQLISAAFEHTVHQPIKDKGLTIFGALVHPEQNIRLVAIQEFKRLAETESFDAKETSSFTSVFEGLFCDASDQVIQQVLELPMLNDIVDSAFLARQLVRLVNDSIKTKNTDKNTDKTSNTSKSLIQSLSFKALISLVNHKITCQDSELVATANQSLLLMFSRLEMLESNTELLVCLKEIPLFSNVADRSLSLLKSKSESLRKIIDILASDVNIVELAACLLTHEPQFNRCFSLAILKEASHTLIPSTVLEKCLEIIRRSSQVSLVQGNIVETHLQTGKVNPSVEWTLVLELVGHIFSGSAPLSDFYLNICFQCLTSKTHLAGVGTLLTRFLSFCVKDQWVEFLGQYMITTVSNAMSINASTGITGLTASSSTGLATSSTSASESLTSTAIKILSLYVQKSQGKSFKQFIPLLLSCLCDTEAATRRAAVECIYKISHAELQTTDALQVLQVFGCVDSLRLSTDALQTLTDELLSKKQEFITDEIQVKQWIKTYFESVQSVKKQSGPESECLLFILSHIQSSTSTPYQIQLLKMLEPVDSGCKLNELYSMMKVPSLTESSHCDASLMNQLTLLITPNSLVKCSEKARKQALIWMQEIPLLPVHSLTDSYDSINFSHQSSLSLLSVPCNSSLASFNSLSSVQQHLLEHITSELFAVISEKKQKVLFECIVQAAVSHADAAVGILAKETLKQFTRTEKIYCSIILAVITNNSRDVQSNPPSKRQKQPVSTESTSSPEYYELVEKLCVILELMSSVNESFVDTFSVVDALVTIVSQLYLNKDVASESSDSGMEYLVQLTYTNLTEIVKRAQGNRSQISDDKLGVDLTVQAIRSTHNFQSRNLMLMYLAQASQLHPQTVLINILPIFTFMGASVLRQDDTFTFHVIQQTIQTIIPALVQSSAKKDLATRIIQLFVDAVTHVPKHRRLRLFTLLISTLGEQEYLSSVVLHLLLKTIEAFDTAVVDQGFVLFVKAVVEHFGEETRLAAVSQLLDYTLEFEELKEIQGKNTQKDNFYEKLNSVAQVKRLNLEIYRFVNLVLVEMAVEVDGKAIGIVEITEKVLKMMRQVRHANNIIECTNEKSTATHYNNTTYKESMLDTAQDTLTAITSLMDTEAFVKMALDLVRNGDDSIKWSSLRLLHHQASKLKKKDEPLMLEISVCLREMLEDSQLKDTNSRQLSCLTMTLIVKQVASDHPEEFINLMPLVCTLVKQEPCVPLLALMSSLTIALGPRILPFLPSSMKLVLALTESNSVDTNLYSALVATLSVFVDQLASFMSPNVSPLLRIIVSSHENAVCASKIADLATILAEKIQIRVLMPQIVKVYNSLAVRDKVESNLGKIVQLFVFVRQTLSNISKIDLVENFKSINAFFLESFGLSSLLSFLKRVDVGEGFSVPAATETTTETTALISEATAETTETTAEATETQKTQKTSCGILDLQSAQDSIIAAYVQMCIKLNENMFRPCFVKVVEWMKADQERIPFFYRLVHEFMTKLKTIFAPFSLLFMDNLVQLLNSPIEDEAMWILLLSIVQKMFLYDHDSVIDADKATIIMKPLLSQIDTPPHFLSHRYLESMEATVIPAISQLAASVHDEQLWKQLNHEICLKTRHENAEIRFICLRVLGELYSRIGEEFLVLLPETIPFLAELMEDNDPTVEKLCHQTCVQIEQILGEDIQQYFN